MKNPDIRGGELLRGERTTESLRQTVILVRSMLSFSHCCELDEGRCTCLKNVDQCKNRIITIFDGAKILLHLNSYLVVVTFWIIVKISYMAQNIVNFVVPTNLPFISATFMEKKFPDRDPVFFLFSFLEKHGKILF